MRLRYGRDQIGGETVSSLKTELRGSMKFVIGALGRTPCPIRSRHGCGSLVFSRRRSAALDCEREVRHHLNRERPPIGAFDALRSL